MLTAGHLSSQTRLCGCQLQSRNVQARAGRRCTTIRAATALPTEVRHIKRFRVVVDNFHVLVLATSAVLPVAVQKRLTCWRQSVRQGR